MPAMNKGRGRLASIEITNRRTTEKIKGDFE